MRIFHWSMVACVALAAITGYFFEDWWLNIHVLAGYGLLCLLAFRLVWGFVGSSYSRFHTFPLSRAGAIAHFKSLLRGKSESHEGHNPVGAWMIVFLLSTLCGLVLSGLFVWGGQENSGPLANVIGYGIGKFSEEIHEFLANLLMAFIALHIAGVLVENFFFKHPLIKAMVFGHKGDGAPHNASTLKTNLLGAVVFGVVFASVTYWINTTPTQPLISAQNPTYRQECGECHPAYHPSLRTAQDWQKMMRNLSDHYGEDASLDAQKTADISTYLQTYNATTFDTKAAHKIGRIETASLRMTDTRFWQKKHDDFKADSFKHPQIGSKVNCTACHQDADLGRFSEAAIKLPKGMKHD